MAGRRRLRSRAGTRAGRRDYDERSRDRSAHGLERRCHCAAAVEVTAGPGGRVTFRSHARGAVASLGLWPFPVDRQGWTQTTIVLPTSPRPDEVAAVVALVASASAWTGRPAQPDVAIGVPPQ